MTQGILGPNGKPLKPEEPENLSLLIDTAVETKVNTAMDNLRENLRQQHRSDTVRGWIKFAVYLFIAALAAIALYIWGPDAVIQWTREFVADNMNKPALAEAADQAIAEKMGGYVDNKLSNIISRIEGLNSGVAEYEKQFTQLNAKQAFLTTASQAQLYDLNSFLALQELASSTNEFAPHAQQLTWALTRQLEYDRVNQSEYMPKENFDGVDYGGPFTSEEIARRFRSGGTESAANWARKEGIRLFVPTLVESALKENNLWVANRVTYAISALTGKEFYPWSLDALSKWWETNQASFTNWPFDACDEVVGKFASVKYQDALTASKSVLDIDTFADYTRYIAVACAVELGSTNEQQSLLSGFKYPDGRWAQLARIKAVLSTGDVAVASSNLAQLVRHSPGLKLGSSFVQEGSHAWRQVDWSIYSAVLAQTNGP